MTNRRWCGPSRTIRLARSRTGQYELGSGTSPTVLGEGKYVAITDNARPMKVVVYRTDPRLDPNEERIVCEVPVFENRPGSPLELPGRITALAHRNQQLQLPLGLACRPNGGTE